jgi:CheY-like chemotaxis protein
LDKILIVNNQPNFLERNEGLLNRTGCRIYTATSALEALQIHQAQRVQLIIAILDMPEMGGDVLCSMIRQDPLLKKVSMLLICQPTASQIERASRCGANAWICKPLQPGLLLQEVGKLISIPMRVDHRADIHGIVRCKLFAGISRNISVSGVLCETDVEIDPKEIITDLSVSICSREIVAEGKVARSVRLPTGLYNYGVQFIGLAPDQRKEIEALVAQNLKAA